MVRVRTVLRIAVLVLAGCSPTGQYEQLARAPVELPRGSTGRLGESTEGVSSTSAALVANRTLSAKVLVVSADGKETTLPAIREALEYLGTPYHLHVVTASPGGLTPALLASGTHGNFQGVILATSSLGYFRNGNWTLPVTAAEWQALWDYEAAFGVRQVTWYSFPTADLGFGPATTVDTAGAPRSISVTTAGASVFSYLSGQLTLQNAIVYLAQPLAGTTPLLVDGAGNALALIRNYADGRQNLAMTFDGNENLVHSVATAYGAINWVTRGLFLGFRRIFASPQVDDIFIESDLWGGGIYRMSGYDLFSTNEWQTSRRTALLSPTLTVSFAFNGDGATVDYVPNDTLIPATRELRDAFIWVNHTLTHQNLDAVTYRVASREIGRNHLVAADLDLGGYTPLNIVTPEISGLDNPAAMGAAYDQGVRFLVTDTSISEPAMPNTGEWNVHQPAIHMTPRRPTNLFYNVSTPAQWVGEYNEMYRSYWGKDLTYAEILDFEAELLAHYMLKGEVYPWMFHQANLRFYSSGRSLMTDLLDVAFAKYSAVYNLPVLSPAFEKLGEFTTLRTRYLAAGVSAIIVPGVSITLVAEKNAVVPVTGLALTGAETYGGQPTSFVTLTAGQSQTFDLPAESGGGAENQAPVLSTLIYDTTATAGVAFSYGVSNSFFDPDAEPLTFTATLTGGAALPSWLTFSAAGQFSGTPASTDVGTLSIDVVASDAATATASDTFVLAVSAAPVQTTEAIFVSRAVEDGWVKESGENSNAGGSVESGGTGDRALRVGDDWSDRQYKSIVSFDTSTLPDGATVTSLKLRLTRGSVEGTNPLTTHVPCYVDVKRGNFGSTASLESADFQAAADVAQAAELVNGGGSGSLYELSLSSAALAAVNTTGRTQLRIYCARDDNDDAGQDIVGFYSADNGTASRRPRLVVGYH